MRKQFAPYCFDRHLPDDRSMSPSKPAIDELASYSYELPKHLIAQEPARIRTDARLMVVDRKRKSISHHHVRDLPQLLRPNDCLVVNDTRVIPARLVGNRVGTGGRWEGLFLNLEPSGAWQLLCKARGRLR
jgi:S-adenosylmethionine:tRNA ribosyltransferase-isomerase